MFFKKATLAAFQKENETLRDDQQKLNEDSSVCLDILVYYAVSLQYHIMV